MKRKTRKRKRKKRRRRRRRRKRKRNRRTKTRRTRTCKVGGNSRQLPIRSPVFNLLFNHQAGPASRFCESL